MKFFFISGKFSDDADTAFLGTLLWELLLNDSYKTLPCFLGRAMDEKQSYIAPPDWETEGICRSNFFFFFCQSILETSLVFWMLFLFGLHPIAEDWFIKILYLPWSVLGNWYISVCIGKVADFIQTILFTDIYVTILVNMWPHRPRNQVLSQFAKL